MFYRTTPAPAPFITRYTSAQSERASKRYSEKKRERERERRRERVIGLHRHKQRARLIVRSFTISQEYLESDEKLGKLFLWLQDIILSIYWNIEGLVGNFILLLLVFGSQQNDCYYCYFYLLLHCHMPYDDEKKVFI